MCKALQRTNTTIVRPILGLSSNSNNSSDRLENEEQKQHQSKKRVSFEPVVRVHVIQRLNPFAVREMFYQPADIHRFRSEACIEILEARADREREPWKSMLRRLKEFVSTTSSSSSSASSYSACYELESNNHAFQYYQPIPTPHEQQQQQQQQQQRILSSRGSSTCTADLKRKSPEMVVQELAFVL